MYKNYYYIIGLFLIFLLTIVISYGILYYTCIEYNSDMLFTLYSIDIILYIFIFYNFYKIYKSYYHINNVIENTPNQQNIIILDTVIISNYNTITYVYVKNPDSTFYLGLLIT